MPEAPRPPERLVDTARAAPNPAEMPSTSTEAVAAATAQTVAGAPRPAAGNQRPKEDGRADTAGNELVAAIRELAALLKEGKIDLQTYQASLVALTAKRGRDCNPVMGYG